MSECKWQWKDGSEVVLVCSVHPDERKVVNPKEKADVVRLLQEAGEWDDGGSLVPSRAVTPAVVSPGGGAVVEYASLSGMPVSLTVQGFQSLLCRDANAQQAQFMMAWCHHNRIDPYANEAHFSIMDSKPVIQVSKDAWFKRVESHPDFESCDDGILIKMAVAALRLAVLTGNEDYRVPEDLRRLVSAPLPEGVELPPKLTIKKRGQFVDDGEELVGGWAWIKRKSRQAPYLFQIPVKGWEQRTKDGNANIFWANKASFMIWKSARKNCARLAFPDLSGLLATPEFDESDAEEGRLLEVPMETPEEQRRALLRTLHAVGHDVPPPLGPFNHLDLHNLATFHYEVSSLAHLDNEQLGELVARVTTAQTDGEVALLLVKEIETVGARSATLKLKKMKTSDEMRAE